MAERNSMGKNSDDRLERAEKRKALEEEEAQKKRAMKAIRTLGTALEYGDGTLDGDAEEAVRVLEDIPIPVLLGLILMLAKSGSGVHGFAPKPARPPLPLPEHFAYDHPPGPYFR